LSALVLLLFFAAGILSRITKQKMILGAENGLF